MRAFWDRLRGRDHEASCELQQLDEKIVKLRQQRHELADRTQVIEFEAYMGRRRREERNAGSSASDRD